MATTKQTTDEELYQRFRRDKDHAAFETLYGRYTPPSGDALLDWKGENLVDWVRFKHHVNAVDADDVVADCWADFIVNQPDINECFSAFAYQKLAWLVADYWDKRRWPEQRKSPESQQTSEQQKKPEKPWLMPWRTLTNCFLPLDDGQFPIMARAENTAALQDERIKARRHTYFLDHAIMQEAMTRLSPEEQQALHLHWIENMTIEEAAKAVGISFARFRRREEKALKRLCSEFFRIRHKTETLEDRMKLLSQWGDVRHDLHWVPDDKNQECDCSECEKYRREAASLCLIVPVRELVIAPTLNVIVQLTDPYGYKLPGQTAEMTFFGVGSGICQEMRIVA